MKRYKEGKYQVVKWNDGSKFWYYKGELHREDGPAVDHFSHNEWYLNDIEYTEKEWKVKMRKLKLKALGI